MMKKMNYPNKQVKELVQIINGTDTNQTIREKLDSYHDNDIADAFGYLTSAQRIKLYSILGAEKLSDIFPYIDHIAPYVEELDLKKAAAIIERMDADDAVDLLDEVKESKKNQLIQYIAQEAKADIALISSYDDDEIGSQMTTNFIHIQNNISIRQAMKSLIDQAKDNDNIKTIYVNDEQNQFYGAIDLTDLIRARDYETLDSLISTSYPYVTDHEKINQCIERIKDYAEDSIPVLNSQHVLLGVITSENLIEVVDSEMSDDYAKLAGLTSEEDLNETLGQSMKKRLPWLIILLILGLFVSSVVGMFETVVSQIALIVCFQSLILDMAGNVGTQSLAVTIRVLVDEELTSKHKLRLVGKELRIGFCNGLLLGSCAFFCVGLYIHFLKDKSLLYAFSLSACVGIALLLAMTISSVIGTTIPMFFHKIKVDPAVASGPLITTINDLVAVITYYGTAWVLILRLLPYLGIE